MLLSQLILTWYQKSKRELPWRSTLVPYNIWVSEIILQQTRVDQGQSYYLRFIEHFPTIRALATAKEEHVLKMWQGLGYYSRARNMHSAAKTVFYDLNGEFPNSSSALLKLKGIGDYTAAAIASIAFNEPIAAIDGNVYRVLSRCFDIDTPIDTSEGKKQFKKLSFELLNPLHPGDYNQGIMELGALICKPKSPLCEDCPLNQICIALKNNTIQDRPVKAKKTKTRNRYFNYIVIEEGQYTYINKRKQNDIWKGLYDFPLIETKKHSNLKQLLRHTYWTNIFESNEIEIEFVSDQIKHILSHQIIYSQFIRIRIYKQLSPDHGFLRIKTNKLKDFAVPKLIDNFIQLCNAL